MIYSVLVAVVITVPGTSGFLFFWGVGLSLSLRGLTLRSFRGAQRSFKDCPLPAGYWFRSADSDYAAVAQAPFLPLAVATGSAIGVRLGKRLPLAVAPTRPLRSVLRAILRPLMRLWHWALCQSQMNRARPTDTPYSHVPGPDPDRVLLLGAAKLCLLSGRAQ